MGVNPFEGISDDEFMAAYTERMEKLNAMEEPDTAMVVEGYGVNHKHTDTGPVLEIKLVGRIHAFAEDGDIGEPLATDVMWMAYVPVEVSPEMVHNLVANAILAASCNGSMEAE